MDSSGEDRPHYFRYKVLEDAEILERSNLMGSKWSVRECCSCTSSLARCLSFARFCVFFTASCFLAMAPWAMALTEAAVVLVVYFMVVHAGGIGDLRYRWRTTEQDIVLYSCVRSVAALAAFFTGLGVRLHVPYLVVTTTFALVGLPFVAVKVVMLSHPLVSKWGALPLVSAVFSVAHVVVATNVNLFARRRYRLGLIARDEEQPWLQSEWPLQQRRISLDAEEVPVEDLVDERSNFVDCSGLKVHFKAAFPLEERDTRVGVVLIHGFGGGAFSWRNVMDALATRTMCRVYAFDRPGFGLTSRPGVDSRGVPASRNPYRLEFQARLVLELCEGWGCRRVVLVGHSDGALVVLRAAALARRAKEGEPRWRQAPAVKPEESGVGSLPLPAPRTAPVSPESDATKPRPLKPPAPVAVPSKASGSFPEEEEATATVPEGEAGGAEAPAAESGDPSSPFSKWLQLGQPEEPQQLQSQLANSGAQLPLSGGDAPGGPEAVWEERDAPQPSLALGFASAVLGPERDRFTGVSVVDSASATSEHGSATRSEGPDGGRAVALGRGIKVLGAALLHPNLDGKVKPQIARILSHSRVGRRILRRLLRTEIGEVSQPRAWYNRDKLEPETLRLYTAPLRVQGGGAALVEACRVRREASEAEIEEDLVSTSSVRKLVATGQQDRIVPPAEVEELARRCGGRVSTTVLPDCGHLSHEEAAEALLSRIVAFVEEILS